MALSTIATSKSAAKIVTVEDHYNKPPLLTERDLIPNVVKDFDVSCRNFFQMKKVEPEEQV
ncbi:hypothetical protein H2248_007605 [Termitomyces sp. 'cryptogamus']|nr:hypothetical protein H2248_007605 [Termitomyces sp. 'cryptogamus']